MTAKKAQQSDELVRLAQETGELFHDRDGIPYADVVAPEPGPHHEIIRIRSRVFRTWMSGRYWRLTGRPSGGQALTDAIDVLSAIAQFEGLERSVGMRIAGHGGALYLDLADAMWRAVEIDATGWRVVARSAVPFRRPRGMRALPVPVSGGNVDELREFINIADEDQYRLLAGWLLGAFRASGPYLCLVLVGEQDAAKSTVARALRSIIDPNEVSDRTLPRDEQAMAIAAGNAWVASFDNVSAMADWQSDALARLATGAGFGTRQLYSDDEEFLVRVSRPIILNGIGGIVTRPDLMDRSIVVDLPTINEETRRDEREFYAALDATRPRILGALLDAASVALAGEDHVVIQRRPRMIDATRWITAAEGVLGWTDRSFLAAYQANRAATRTITIDASPLVAPLRDLLDRGPWSGTATDLLKALEQRVADADVKRRDWPKTAAALGTDLRRLAPDLRRVESIEIMFPSRHGGRRVLALARLSEEPSPLSQPSQRDTGDTWDSDAHSRATNDESGFGWSSEPEELDPPSAWAEVMT
jgi:hypothetical protein